MYSKIDTLFAGGYSLCYICGNGSTAGGGMLCAAFNSNG